MKFENGAKKQDKTVDDILTESTLIMRNLTRMFLPVLIQQKSGYIMNIASPTKFPPSLSLKTTHAVARAIVIGFTESLLLDSYLHFSHIGVGAVHPGSAEKESKDNHEDQRAQVGVKTLFSTPEVAADYILNSVKTGSRGLVVERDDRVQGYLLYSNSQSPLHSCLFFAGRNWINLRRRIQQNIDEARFYLAAVIATLGITILFIVFCQLLLFELAIVLVYEL